MLYTPYFGNKSIPEHIILVSIAVSTPKWFKERFVLTKVYQFNEVKPDWNLVENSKRGLITKECYTKKYLEVLEQHKQEILEKCKRLNEMGVDAVFLCWEAPGKFCHRHLFSSWLRECGFEIKEYSHKTEKINTVHL